MVPGRLPHPRILLPEESLLPAESQDNAACVLNLWEQFRRNSFTELSSTLPHRTLRLVPKMVPGGK